MFERLKEPSTLAGIAVLLQVWGVPAGVPDLAVQILTGLAGLAAVYLPERGK